MRREETMTNLSNSTHVVDGPLHRRRGPHSVFAKVPTDRLIDIGPCAD